MCIKWNLTDIEMPVNFQCSYCALHTVLYNSKIDPYPCILPRGFRSLAA